MQISLKKFLESNSGLKVMAIAMGFSLWSWMNIDSRLQVPYEMPICFYEIADDCALKSPERITVCLHGSRRALSDVFEQHPALHINAESLKEGINDLFVAEQKIFLPDSVKLLHCSSQKIQVVKEKKA